MRYFLAVLLALAAAGARAGENASLRRRPIVYFRVMTASRTPTGAAYHTVWHVAWCRPGMGVRLRTKTITLRPDQRRRHFAAHWAYDHAAPGETLVAVNGAVFNQSVVPPLPIGGVGNGGAGWMLGSDATHAKFCLGLTGDGRRTPDGYPPFQVMRMRFLYRRPGTGAAVGGQQPFYGVSKLIKRHYPYGFGCVGRLIAKGGYPVYDADRGGWQGGESLHPQMTISRTALGWTRQGDVFIAVAGGPENIAGPGTPPGPGDGATWRDTVRLFAVTLPRLMAGPYRSLRRPSPRPFRVDEAVMFDGGGNSQMGYERTDRRGRRNRDQSAPHGNELSADISRCIPSFLYAVADEARPRRHRRRHH